MTTKGCTKCGIEKTHAEFYSDARRKSGVSSWCRECWREYERLRRERLGPRGRKNRKLKYLYGMTIQEYMAMLKNQNGLCAICGEKETVINPKSSKVQKLCVDHDHKNGKVRGLLCSACNKALGLLNDDTTRVMKAHDYLKKYEEEHNESGRDEQGTEPDTARAGEATADQPGSPE